MNKGSKSGIWFPAKQYGWGWGIPCHPLGWLTLLGFISGVVLLSVALSLESIGIVSFFLLLSALVVGLLIVCYLKGEKPKWRWGDDD